MADNKGLRDTMDPLVSFAFSVSMDGAGEVARCSSVDGLSKEIEQVEYRSSEDPNHIGFIPGRRKAARITLKKAVLSMASCNVMYQWISENPPLPRNLTIAIGQYGRFESELKSNKNPTYKLDGCVPTKWSVATLDGNSNSALYETIEIVCSNITAE